MDNFWKENIFAELNYKNYFKYFLIITCSLNSEEENGDSLFGFIKSKIRKAMEIWSKNEEFEVHLENKILKTNLKENLLEYRILSGYEEKGRCRVDEDENPRQCSIWVIGINFSDKIYNWEIAKRLINCVYVQFQWYSKNNVKIQTIPVEAKNLEKK
uniref:Uncharacterized protein n=1 Tax=Meloidogyne enterolobii TaxID=390850 RepID=A0A6V7UVT4_MELEN|nr:unnamed protein product [Meloidogyne enterolobii]